ncbi:WecB/TagA/CpsF family glycosyltransferase [Puniceicoccaceae bacterium K14]|nr:WecB/TagA/CpsF family glycosyltransferase [Puniceicoccaceae bacterium K14]
MSDRNPMPPTIKVLDIPMFDGNIPDACEIVKSEVAGGQRLNRCVSATGAHGLVTSKSDEGFKSVLQSFFMNLPDGMPGVWVARKKGAKRIERCYGPDFFEYILRHTAEGGIKHYFCGGKEGVPEKLKQACEDKFNNRNVVGTLSPPFRELSDDEMRGLGKEISDLGTDIIWVGISTPKQEKFALRLAKYANVHFLVTVGAAFDFHIGGVKQAPSFMQKNGLEWLFRLCVEPKRLWKRYVHIVPMFIIYNLREWLAGNKA